MEWLSFLLLLICPLMMLFCMKGHMVGRHNHNKTNLGNNLEKRMHFLEEENKKLQKELDEFIKMLEKDS
jgi:hypothetical protein